jgi:circadian clock protein KaiC
MMAMLKREFVLKKCPTGIKGFDEIRNGGLPKGRPPVLAMEFLLRGAIHYKEPGVLVSFEETAVDQAQNFASLGYALNDMIGRNLIAVGLR